jgi:DNA-binding NarL/FixJ family response regulator
VVVADDHPLMRKGLEAVFGAERDFAVLGACSSDAETLHAVRIHRPDVLVVSLRTPGLDGLRVLRTLKDEAVPVRVVMLITVTDDDANTLEVVRLGAAAVVPKETAPALLVQCLRKVHAGERRLEWTGVGRALDTLLREEAGLREFMRALTTRELDVVRMIVRGLRNAEIAIHLRVSEGTVKSHLHHIYEKLSVDGRMGLMVLARQRGLG